MPFPPAPGIPVGTLTAATPTPLNATALKAQLEAIGLDCAQLNDMNLQSYIDQVNSQLPTGTVQSFAITAPASAPTPLQAGQTGEVVSVLSLSEAVPASENSATGNWTISTSAQGYAPHLGVIQFPDHFNWLYANRATNAFAGVRDDPPAYTGNYPNAEAIQKLFVNVGVTASATLVKGLDQDTIRAAMSNAIQPLQNANLTNYNVSDSRAIFLVDNYNTSTGTADAIGVLSIGWTLKITDWKRKTKEGGDTHPTNLTVMAESVLYSDPTVLCNDYHAVLKQFGIDPATAPKCPVS